MAGGGPDTRAAPGFVWGREWLSDHLCQSVSARCRVSLTGEELAEVGPLFFGLTLLALRGRVKR